MPALLPAAAGALRSAVWLGCACFPRQLLPEPCLCGRTLQAVLHALNSGGNNMARAGVTGALVGALVGASGIPQRFVDGLAGGRELAALAQRVAAAAFPDECRRSGLQSVCAKELCGAAGPAGL